MHEAAWNRPGLLLLLLSAPFFAQTVPPAQPPSPDTSHVTCGEKTPASNTVRGSVLVSADGKCRVYAEVEATAPQRPAGSSGPLCVNQSRLFVASEERDFKLVFLAEPSDQESGNSLRVVDWSPDSRRLLVELAQWQYDSLGINRSILIYDTRNGTFQQPDLGHALSRQFGIECSLNIHVAGFTPEGKIVLETEPLAPEEEEVLAVPTCSRKKATFLMDRPTETLSPAPESLKLQHYAKSEAAK